MTGRLNCSPVWPSYRIDWPERAEAGRLQQVLDVVDVGAVEDRGGEGHALDEVLRQLDQFLVGVRQVLVGP